MICGSVENDVTNPEVRSPAGIVNGEDRMLVLHVPPSSRLVYSEHSMSEPVGALLTEAIISNLAAMMAVELNSIEGLVVDPSRITGLEALAQKRTKEVEAQERDNSPIYFVAGIGPYTR